MLFTSHIHWLTDSVFVVVVHTVRQIQFGSVKLVHKKFIWFRFHWMDSKKKKKILQKCYLICAQQRPLLIYRCRNVFFCFFFSSSGFDSYSFCYCWCSRCTEQTFRFCTLFIVVPVTIVLWWLACLIALQFCDCNCLFVCFFFGSMFFLFL